METSDQKGINDQFKKFYGDTTENCDSGGMADFFDGLGIPTVAPKKDFLKHFQPLSSNQEDDEW